MAETIPMGRVSKFGDGFWPSSSTATLGGGIVVLRVLILPTQLCAVIFQTNFFEQLVHIIQLQLASP